MSQFLSTIGLYGHLVATIEALLHEARTYNRNVGRHDALRAIHRAQGVGVFAYILVNRGLMVLDPVQQARLQKLEDDCNQLEELFR